MRIFVAVSTFNCQNRPKTVTTSTKVDRREIIRERKALKAAQLEKAIENELLERLRQVSETEIYNYPEKQYTRALKISQKGTSKEDEEEEDDEETPAVERVRRNKEVEEEYDDEDELEDAEVEDDDDYDDSEAAGLDGNYNIEFVEVSLQGLICN